MRDVWCVVWVNLCGIPAVNYSRLARSRYSLYRHTLCIIYDLARGGFSAENSAFVPTLQWCGQPCS